MNKGFYIKKNRIKSDAKPIDNITKFAWDDEDYEEVEERVPKWIVWKNEINSSLKHLIQLPNRTMQFVLCMKKT